MYSYKYVGITTTIHVTMNQFCIKISSNVTSEKQNKKTNSTANKLTMHHLLLLLFLCFLLLLLHLLLSTSSSCTHSFHFFLCLAFLWVLFACSVLPLTAGGKWIPALTKMSWKSQMTLDVTKVVTSSLWRHISRRLGTMATKMLPLCPIGAIFVNYFIRVSCASLTVIHGLFRSL